MWQHFISAGKLQFDENFKQHISLEDPLILVVISEVYR